MRISENYRLQRSNARLDHLQEGLEETATTPFPLTPEGVIDYLFNDLVYDMELFQQNAEITSVTVTEEVRGIKVVVTTIQDNTWIREARPFLKGGTSFLIDLDGKVIEEEDLSYEQITKEDYESAYQEVSKVRGYASLVTIR